MPDAELLHAWQANGITEITGLAWDDWRRCGMLVQAENGQQAYVRRHDRTTWSLSYSQHAARNRWGNAVEIGEDLEFFLANGRLPAPAGDRW